ncbi:hypothetical protein JCM16303_004712 [Sporobolomyces ruberrimus]
MPLWSSNRSNSYSSSSGAPQLPPLPTFTPPSTSHLPHFASSSSNPSSTNHLSKLSISKGKQRQGQFGTQGEEEEEDDPWQDGSDDESTRNKLSSTSVTPSSAQNTRESPTSYTSSSSHVRTPTVEKPTGGGWFSSFTSFGSSPQPPTSSSSSNHHSTSPPSRSSTLPAVLRRQPSAKDVALALSSSPNSSSSTKKRETLGLPGEGLKRSQGSYIGKVNEVQKEAEKIVREEEVKRNSIERVGKDMPPEEDKGKQVGQGEGEEKKGMGMGSEKERLRKSIRPDILKLVQDPTSVLPRLRREWLTRPSSNSTSHQPSPSEPSPQPPTSDPSRPDSIASFNDNDDNDNDDDHTPRRSISSQLSSESSEDGRPRGYVPLNAASLSSSSKTKPIVDYQKEYVQQEPSSSSSSRTGTGTGTNRVKSLLEEPGEFGREIRRKKKFLDVLQGIGPEDHEDEAEEEELEGEGDGEGDGIGGEKGGQGETDLGELRKLSWGGVPEGLRVVVWMLLLGYLPSPFSRRQQTLARKRQEYADAVKLAFSRGVQGLDGPIWHQISIDVPRTRPGVKLWMVEGTQRSLERILYVWAIRHPASGYVQGINDLVTPFFQVFLSLYIDSDPEEFDPSLLPPSALEALEADSFWCLSKLLDGIQDNYIFAQPGITRAVKKMELLCKRVDAPLAKHLQSEGVEFIQFAFRWMNCLLMRELSVKNIVRMWDTYLAEGGDAFSEFHLYVCLSFLVKWSEQLRTMDFQSIIMFLQSLPTKDWKDSNTELLLSEAFMWSRTFEAR